MISSALIRGVPRISHYDLDATLSQMIDHVINRALKTVERGTTVARDVQGIQTKVDRQPTTKQQERSITT
jgi:hypothetical protein